MTILSTLKKKLVDTLFKKEFELIEQMRLNLDQRHELYLVEEKALATKQELFDSQVKNPAYWIKHITAQYNPLPDLLSDYNEDVLSMVADTPGFDTDIDTFMSDISDIYKNKSFKILLKCLMHHQVRYCGMQDAGHKDQFNYARATLNGYLILDKEVEDIHNLQKAKIEPQEEFDPHASI